MGDPSRLQRSPAVSRGRGLKWTEAGRSGYKLTEAYRAQKWAETNPERSTSDLLRIHFGRLASWWVHASGPVRVHFYARAPWPMCRDA